MPIFGCSKLWRRVVSGVHMPTGLHAHGLKNVQICTGQQSIAGMLGEPWEALPVFVRDTSVFNIS